MISHRSEKTITCTIVGDGMVGKTTICQTFAGKSASEDYKATVTDEFTVKTQVMGDKYMIRIIDSSGQHDYEDIRKRSYKDTDVFIVCYNVTDRDSFESIEGFWMSEIRKLCKKTPIILVATGIGSIDEKDNVSKEEGLMIMDKCGVDAYVECETNNKDQVAELFEDVLLSVKSRKRRRSSLLYSLIHR